jgi:hypothetical protein
LKEGGRLLEKKRRKKRGELCVLVLERESCLGFWRREAELGG